MQFSFVAVRGIEPDVAGIAGGIVIEGKIIIIFRRIYSHAVGKTAEHERQHRHEISGRERRRACRILDESLVGIKPRTIGVLGGESSTGHDERKQKSGRIPRLYAHRTTTFSAELGIRNLPGQFPQLNRRFSGRCAPPEIEDCGQRPKFNGCVRVTYLPHSAATASASRTAAPAANSEAGNSLPGPGTAVADLRIMAAGWLVAADPHVVAADRLVAANPHVVTTGRFVAADPDVVAAARLVAAEFRVVDHARSRPVSEFRIVNHTGDRPVGEFRIMTGDRPVGEFRIVAGDPQVGEFRIVAGYPAGGELRIVARDRSGRGALILDAVLAVMAQDWKCCTGPRVVGQWRAMDITGPRVMGLWRAMDITGPRVMGLWRAMNTQHSIVATRAMRGTDVPVMGHLPRMRALPFVTELRIMRSMPTMAVLRVM